MATKPAKHRFATYLNESEYRETEIIRAELGLPTKQPNAMQDRQILTIMRLATRIVMDDIRKQKHARMTDADTEMPLAEWQDICKAAGVPEAFFERILNEDPRPSSVRRRKSAKDDGELESDNDDSV